MHYWLKLYEIDAFDLYTWFSFPWAWEQVSKQSEQCGDKQMSDHCEQISKKMSKWPGTLCIDFIVILPNVQWKLSGLSSFFFFCNFYCFFIPLFMDRFVHRFLLFLYSTSFLSRGCCPAYVIDDSLLRWGFSLLYCLSYTFVIREDFGLEWNWHPIFMRKIYQSNTLYNRDLASEKPDLTAEGHLSLPLLGLN